MENQRGIILKSNLEVTGLIFDFYYEFPDDFSYDGERHSGWEFVYVERGRVLVRAENATYILKKGEMVCHKPFEFHSIKPYDGKAAVIIFCFEVDNEYMEYFNNKIVSVNQRQKQYLNDIANLGSLVLQPKDPMDIVHNGKMDISDNASPQRLQFVKNTIELLLLSLIDSSMAEKQSRITLYEQVTQRQTLTEKIIEYLNENIDKTITLEDISNNFSYSLSSIKRIFKEETGTSVLLYLNNLRMHRAKELLLSTDMSISNIASSLGFSNIYYFSTAFKKKWGISPTNFRLNDKK